jgi:hypothetical protein
MSIKLTAYDLQQVIEALAQVVEYKELALRPMTWAKFNNEYLASIIDQIQDNQFKLNHPTKNVFGWMIDQMCHSRRLHPGVPHKEGAMIIDTKLGLEVAEICRAACRGQSYYDSWRQGSTFRNLFD